MHGPGLRTTTNPYGWEPDYPDPTRVTVIDTLAPTLGRIRRKTWRRARDKGLAKWAPAGIGFRVRERDPEDFAPYVLYDGSIPAAFYGVSGKIRIVRMVGDMMAPGDAPDGTTYRSFATFAKRSDPQTGERAPGAGIAVFDPWAPWWKDWWLKTLAADIGHEIGHTLGLAHRSDGGIMAGGWNPDPHDLDSVRRYYSL